MGTNMARRLKDLDYPVTAVFDSIAQNAISLAAELECQAPPTLPEVTAAADAIFTVVSDDAAMEALFLAPTGNLLVEARGKTFINCATVHPATHEKVAAAAAEVGASCLEGCMASSITQAREGTLYLMVGGEREIYEKQEALLKDLSKSMRYIGPTGSAAKVKALVNMVMNANTAALAEGLGLGQALGLDLDILMEVFSQTGAHSRVLETDGADMRDRDHECYFSAAHAAKDSGIANDLAREAGVRVPVSESTAEQYRKMVAMGLGDLDKSGIAELTFPRRGDGSADSLSRKSGAIANG